jgi:hypothetical protein
MLLLYTTTVLSSLNSLYSLYSTTLLSTLFTLLLFSILSLFSYYSTLFSLSSAPLFPYLVADCPKFEMAEGLSPLGLIFETTNTSTCLTTTTEA